MLLPALACRECGQDFVLPYRSLLQSAVIDPFWPMDQEDLIWVCDHCQRYSSFRFTDIHERPGITPPAAERGFWRVEIPCSEPDCSATVVGYTQTYGQTSRSTLGRKIASAHPTLDCRLGHPVSVQHCYPLELDFVEWNGPEERVV